MKVIVPVSGPHPEQKMLAVGSLVAHTLGGYIEILDSDSWSDQTTNIENCSRTRGMKASELVNQLPFVVPVSVSHFNGNSMSEVLRRVSSDQQAMLLLPIEAEPGPEPLDAMENVEQLCRNVNIPVVLVPMTKDPVNRAIQAVLVPLDGTAQAKSILPFAIDFARRIPQAQMHIIVIQESEGSLAELESMHFYLDEIAREIRSHQVRVNWEVRSGTVSNEILRTAATIGADLMLTSWEGFADGQSAPLSKVLCDVIQSTTVPMLIAPSSLQHVVDI